MSPTEYRNQFNLPIAKTQDNVVYGLYYPDAKTRVYVLTFILKAFWDGISYTII